MIQEQILKTLSLLVTTFLFFSFNSSTLNLEKKITINVSEPSALSFSMDKKSLFTVSDSDGSIHQLDLNGNVIKIIKTRASDLEGIVFHPDLNGYCVTEERIRKISCFDLNGKLLKSKAISFTGSSNAGFEGITYNSLNKHFYVVNEKKPTAILELDSDLNLIKTINFNFLSDLSDIAYDEEENKFYILSHESQKIILTDHLFNIENTFSIPNVIQAEGLVVDKINRKIYVVSDKDSSFNTFTLN